MLLDDVFDSKGVGVFVLRQDGEILLLEFNAFLQRIANQTVQANDTVVAKVYTDGERRRAGDLQMFARVQSGLVRTDDLPIRTPDGILAEGPQALILLDELESA